MGILGSALGMTGEKMGRRSGFREIALTFCDRKRNVAPVRRRKPAEPRRTAARQDEGKPEGPPQGGPEGGREKAARPDRGSALSSARSSRPEREEDSGDRRAVLRNGDFPGAAGLGPGWDCPTRSWRGVDGTSQTLPRGAREASAERLLGVASRPGPYSGATSGPRRATRRRTLRRSPQAPTAWPAAPLGRSGGPVPPVPMRDRPGA